MENIEKDLDNISFFINDNSINVNDVNIDLKNDFYDILNEIENTELKQKYNYENDIFDTTIPQMMDYSINFTVKELLLICDYYGISKTMKTNKCNKELIINILVLFENNPVNEEIVLKRKNMWFYINQLKNDKFMKKYILW